MEKDIKTNNKYNSVCVTARKIFSTKEYMMVGLEVTPRNLKGHKVFLV